MQKSEYSRAARKVVLTTQQVSEIASDRLEMRADCLTPTNIN
jgi:hypothetical protein